MISLCVIAIYLSFALDFVFFPIPSQASTHAMIKASNRRDSIKMVCVVCVQGLILFLWISPLYVAAVALLPLQACFFACDQLAYVQQKVSLLSAMGLVFALVGRMLTISASLTVRGAKPGNLLTDGVFAHSRHPIVLGLHLTLCGLLIATGTGLLWLLFPCVLIYFDYKIRIEEAHLITQFGGSYKDYCKRTKRYWQFGYKQGD